jgi:hypothetical protein
MKNLFTALSFFLAGALALGLTGCGGSNSTTATIPAGYSTSSWADVAVAAGDQTVTLSWTDSNNPTNSTSTTYNMYYSTSPGVTPENGQKLTNVANPYIHSGLIDGTTYYYVITAVTSGMESTASKEISATPHAQTPAAPQSLQIQPGDGQVTLTLVNSSGQLITPAFGTVYNIYYNTGASENVTTTNGKKISNVTSITNTGGFTHSGLTNGTTYNYIVTAQLAESESSPSAQVSATPQPASTFVGVNNVFTNNSTATLGSPPSPTAVSAYASNQQVTLNWTPSAKTNITFFKSTDGSTTINSANTALQYYINWSNSENQSGTILVSPSTATTFTHTALDNNVTYSYSVYAVASSATYLTQYESAIMAPVSVVPTPYTPPAPYGVSASTTDQEVDLSWQEDTSGGLVTYNIIWWTAATQQNPTTLSGIESTSYSHTGLTTGTTYYYIVTATSPDGKTSPVPSNAEVSATP